jgi:hypothetical protein
MRLELGGLIHQIAAEEAPQQHGLRIESDRIEGAAVRAQHLIQL